MTTTAAAQHYEDEHNAIWKDKGWAIYNPNNSPIAELPIIYGFNNGGGRGFLSAVLLAQDGTCLGAHICSSESYMPHDLGIVDGSRPDRHETFRAHYSNGYRMEFVKGSDVERHPGLNEAYRLNQAQVNTPDQG